MRPIKFYINEPVIHDSSIESKKDFKKLLQKMPAANSRSTNLSVAWIAGISTCLILVLGLSIFTDLNQQESKKPMNVNRASDAQLAETSKENIRFTISPTDSSQLNKAPLTGIDDPNQNKEAEVMMLQVENQDAARHTTRSHIEPITSLHTSAVSIARQGLETIPANLQIPGGLPISVDLITYAEIKMADDFYFELDSSSFDKTESMMAHNWKEAELRHHPAKNKYRMILSNGKEQLEFIVRLVIQSNSQIKHIKRKFRLRNLTD